MNKTENKQTPNIDKLLKALSDLKKNITAEDRDEAPVSRLTVSAYLNKKGTKETTAIRLLEYFRGRIEKRKKYVDSLTAQS